MTTEETSNPERVLHLSNLRPCDLDSAVLDLIRRFHAKHFESVGVLPAELHEHVFLPDAFSLETCAERHGDRDLLDLDRQPPDLDGTVDAEVSFAWTVADTNRAPNLTDPGDQSDAEGDVVSLGVTGSDPDGDGLVWSATGLP